MAKETREATTEAKKSIDGKLYQAWTELLAARDKLNTLE